MQKIFNKLEPQIYNQHLFLLNVFGVDVGLLQSLFRAKNTVFKHIEKLLNLLCSQRHKNYARSAGIRQLPSKVVF